MKIKAFSLFIIVLLIVSCVDDAYGQRSRYKKKRKVSKGTSSYRGGSRGGKFRPYQFVSAHVNALNYYGDLAPASSAGATDVSFTRPGFGLNFGAKVHPNIAVRSGLNWGRLQADDFSSDPTQEENVGRYWRNLSFRNDIYEFHLGFEFHYFPNRGGPNVRPVMNFYLFAGGALIYHNPKGQVPIYDYQTFGPETTEKLKNGGEWVPLRRLGTEGQFMDDSPVKPYSLIQPTIPIAIGATMRLPGPFDLGIEFGYRILFFDYIDDVSGVYVSLDKFENKTARIMSDRSGEPITSLTGANRNLNDLIGAYTYENGSYYTIAGNGLDGSIRGNPKDNDMYFITSLKLTAIIGSVNSSAKFR